MPVPPRTLARMIVLVLMESDDGPWEVGFSVRIVGSPFFVSRQPPPRPAPAGKSVNDLES